METLSSFEKEILKRRCLEFNVLRKMTNDLCNSLPINGLLPNLVSTHVIDVTDCEEIRGETTERRRVMYF